MTSDWSYSDEEKKAVYKAIAQRRDMRHFTDKSIDQAVFARILASAHQAPSVGLMQPWRFIRITDQQVKQSIVDIVNDERQQTAQALDERKQEFLALKVEGILQCAEVVVAALPDQREKHIFGRRTLPPMDFASLCCAIQNMWLAARVEGIGMGWVSMFDPEKIIQLLQMPDDSLPIAILCLGHVEAFYEQPMLVLEQWAEQKPLKDFLFENQWGKRLG